jgi:hypothetical protein
MLTGVFGSGGFCNNSTSNPLAILGTSRKGLGDHWHITAGTEKKPPKSDGCGISANAPWADCWHIADVTARYANGWSNHCAKCHSRQIRCRVVAKSAGSGESVFTSMDVVLYGLLLADF